MIGLRPSPFVTCVFSVTNLPLGTTLAVLFKSDVFSFPSGSVCFKIPSTRPLSARWGRCFWLSRTPAGASLTGGLGAAPCSPVGSPVWVGSRLLTACGGDSPDPPLGPLTAAQEGGWYVFPPPCGFATQLLPTGGG